MGIVLATLLGAGVAWYAVQLRAPEPPVAAAPTGALPPGGDFTLQSTAGAVSLADFRGKVVVLYFGYTACPDICPTSMATLKGGFSQLAPAELAQVQGLFVSVDPERDTLEYVQRYAGFFHPNILGLGGKLDELQAITKQYGAFFRKVEMPGSAMGYTIDHTSTLYVLDKDGKVQSLVQHAVPPAELAAAIRRLL
jgi:protein SCO1/2